MDRCSCAQELDSTRWMGTKEFAAFRDGTVWHRKSLNKKVIIGTSEHSVEPDGTASPRPWSRATFIPPQIPSGERRTGVFTSPAPRCAVPQHHRDDPPGAGHELTAKGRREVATFSRAVRGTRPTASMSARSRSNRVLSRFGDYVAYQSPRSAISPLIRLSVRSRLGVVRRSGMNQPCRLPGLVTSPAPWVPTSLTGAPTSRRRRSKHAPAGCCPRAVIGNCGPEQPKLTGGRPHGQQHSHR